jgi:Basic region leucine zipper
MAGFPIDIDDPLLKGGESSRGCRPREAASSPMQEDTDFTAQDEMFRDLINSDMFLEDHQDTRSPCFSSDYWAEWRSSDSLRLNPSPNDPTDNSSLSQTVDINSSGSLVAHQSVKLQGLYPVPESGPLAAHNFAMNMPLHDPYPYDSGELGVDPSLLAMHPSTRHLATMSMPDLATTYPTSPSMDDGSVNDGSDKGKEQPPSDDQGRRDALLLRNRIAAAKHRQKKKTMENHMRDEMDRLRKEVTSLVNANQSLKKERDYISKVCVQLREELRSAAANASKKGGEPSKTE